MRYKFLLGATKDNEIVFGDFGTRLQYGDDGEYEDFSASFDVVRPFDVDQYDVLQLLQDMIDDSGAGWAYAKCCEYDCAPSELAECMNDDCGDIRDVVDCSLYPEWYTIGDTDWCFESGSCGQCDTRENMAEYVNKEAYDKLCELWDNYHLKKADANVISEVEKLADVLLQTDEEEWITDFIKRHEDELH